MRKVAHATISGHLVKGQHLSKSTVDEIYFRSFNKSQLMNTVDLSMANQTGDKSIVMEKLVYVDAPKPDPIVQINKELIA